MCDEYDGDGREIEAAWVRARKEHRCYACHEAIRVGDRHHVVVQIDEGELYRFRHCARCWTIVLELLEAGAESVQYNLNCGARWEDNFGELPEKVAELAFMTRDEAQARLVPA